MVIETPATSKPRTVTQLLLLPWPSLSNGSGHVNRYWRTTVNARSRRRSSRRALGLRFPCLRNYPAHLDCVFQASGIIPRTWIAFSKPPELSRAHGLRFPSLRDYPGHLDCAFHASGIIPRTLFARSWPPEGQRWLYRWSGVRCAFIGQLNNAAGKRLRLNQAQWVLQ
jgi:hypothetical protein